MKIIHILCLAILLAVTCALPSAAATVGLDTLAPIYASQGWGQLQTNKSVQGNRLQIGDRRFGSGLGTHARSEIVYELDGRYGRLKAWVGVDAEMKDYTQPSVVFKVFADGRELFSSGIMKIDTPAMQVNVPLFGVTELKLVVEDAGDGSECDHADWADAVLIGSPGVAPSPKATKYMVRGPGITLKLSDRGEIAGVILGKTEHGLTGSTRLFGCSDRKPVLVRSLPNGGMEFERALLSTKGLGEVSRDECRLIERFFPTKTSIRWGIEIVGNGVPWSTPIITQLRWPDTKEARFWTAWDDPELSGVGWHDPLVSLPFAVRSMWVGVPPIGPDPQGGCNYTGGDTVSIPIASILMPASDTGVSLVLSPEDLYLDTAFSTRDDGTITFARANHRITNRPIKFAADIVPHKGDWRSALGWVVKRYPAYFDPPNPKAGAIAGCGAYSAHEGDLDLDKFNKMAFRVNWKASFDFPYIGMFLPPVKTDDEKWPRFDADSSGNLTGGHTETSIAQMSAYSRRMRDAGFYVLNYFNVTEIGAGLNGTELPSPHPADPDIWRDPKLFIPTILGDAVVINEAGRKVGSWGGALLLDCAVPSYRDFLLDQAKRHVEKPPASSGICIDRMDWLSAYNSNADDGVSWRGGKAMRVLSESWKSLMSRLGPLMHSNGKVIFANVMLKRLDLVRELDGIYHEFGHLGPCLNGTAFLCVRKPAIAWTPEAWVLGDDPDAYFQRHLHLGVFPTAPVPGNDHTIRPSEFADKWYLDYGPLLDLMRGKKWVLDPHVIEVEGSAAKANLFEVPGGFVVPITFGGTAGSVRVTIRRPSVLREWPRYLAVTALHPGSDQPATVNVTANGDLLQMTVPLSRGCAMVRIKTRTGGMNDERAIR